MSGSTPAYFHRPLGERVRSTFNTPRICFSQPELPGFSGRQRTRKDIFFPFIPDKPE